MRSAPLVRALSKLGLASRSEGRRAIADGRVTVDGRVVRDPLTPVVIGRSRVALDDVRGERPARVVIALHKPRGVVTTRRDPEGRPTVYDLIVGVPTRVQAVGRLDLATSGLLLFTNDTALANWLTSPESGVTKVYLATVRGRVTEEEAERLRRGIEDRGEHLQAHDVVVRKASNRESHLVITLTEGRNREIRRLCKAIGHELTRLRRVQIGELELGTLNPGAWRLVSDNELARVFGRGWILMERRWAALGTEPVSRKP